MAGRASTAFVLLLGSVAGAALTSSLIRDERAFGERPPDPTAVAIDGARQMSQSFKAAAKKLRPSVLNITSERFLAPGQREETFGSFIEQLLGGRSPEGQLERSFGTGFVVRADGLALTNHHVIAGAKRVRAHLDDGTEVSATVLGTDPLSDLAVLQLDERPDGQPYVPVEFGDSDALEVGDWVLAVGSPFQLDQTVTAGIVSAKGRSRVGIAAYEDFIQTDAAINPGNSGGPLVDLDGRVVGVATAIASRSGGYQGVGFAIPVTMASDVVNDIVAHGRVIRGWLAVYTQDADPELSAALGGPERKSVVVGSVRPGGPGANSGLQAGDVVLAFDGEVVEESTRLRHLIARAPVGQPLPMVICRDGQELTVPITTAERPSEDAGPAPAEAPQAQGLGVTCRQLTPELARLHGYRPTTQGVVISRITPGSVADERGLREGLIVQAINGNPILNLDALDAMVGQMDLNEGVLLRLWNGQTSIFVLLKYDSAE